MERFRKWTAVDRSSFFLTSNTPKLEERDAFTSAKNAAYGAALFAVLAQMVGVILWITRNCQTETCDWKPLAIGAIITNTCYYAMWGMSPGEVQCNGSETNPDGIPLRYCTVCEIWQPVRTKHCDKCRKCIPRFDHHCFWIGTCVGARNHRFFLGFVVVAFFYLIQVTGYLCECFIWNPHATTEINVLWNLLPFVLLLIGLFLALFVGSLVVFHCWLASSEATTWEFASAEKITYMKHLKRRLPFNRGTLSNLFSFFCPQFTQQSS